MKQLSNVFTVHVSSTSDPVGMFAWMVCCEACGETMNALNGGGALEGPLIHIVDRIHAHLRNCKVRPMPYKPAILPP